MVVGVAAVDDDIPLIQIGKQLLDELVHRLARLQHHHDFPGWFKTLYKISDLLKAADVFASGPAGQKLLRPGEGAVVNRHRKPLGLHIQHQVLAHYGKPGNSESIFHVSTHLDG